jgi:mannose-6-phosphate isomerase-like protein (cupin superfamily)
MSYPIYSREEGEISAKFRPALQEPDLFIGERVKVRYLATGASTETNFGLYRWDMAPVPSTASAHFHKTMSESFFILSGAVRLFNGERWVEATSGDFLYVPPGGIHGFSNESGQQASMLILFAPGMQREPYFEAIAAMAMGHKFTDEEWAKICIKHDNYFIDPKSKSLYEKLNSAKNG